jgi:hypothetical protein
MGDNFITFKICQHNRVDLPLILTYLNAILSKINGLTRSMQRHEKLQPWLDS